MQRTCSSYMMSVYNFYTSDLAFAINHNFTNWVKSCISMLAMARANAFPEIDFSHFKLYQPSTLLRLANIQSHSRNSFLAPLKEIALQTYQTVHMAMIRQKESMLKDLTSGEFQKSYLRTMRKRPADVVIHWNIVSDISDEALFPKSRRPLITPPVTVVSVRAVEVYFAKEDPKLGHRLVIQALVKFDVSQSVKLTDREGRTVGDESGEPHRVVQYLILEKVGWYDSPWRFKEQVYRS
ncbi:hypothetical protein F5I97DRAFT_1102176 [Phlebopus sp. FC_14]|nr:hypothetical protein F5I97DRAFT_1102176 [Phlebopus sp. FC_14]